MHYHSLVGRDVYLPREVANYIDADVKWISLPLLVTHSGLVEEETNGGRLSS